MEGVTEANSTSPTKTHKVYKYESTALLPVAVHQEDNMWPEWGVNKNSCCSRRGRQKLTALVANFDQAGFRVGSTRQSGQTIQKIGGKKSGSGAGTLLHELASCARAHLLRTLNEKSTCVLRFSNAVQKTVFTLIDFLHPLSFFWSFTLEAWRQWAAILFHIGPSNALWLTQKLRKQDGGAHGLAPSKPPL